jgi:imidazole glycerol-phosphate synthase subunit HisH
VSEVVIVDSGGANLASLRFAFERLGARTQVTGVSSEISSAERVVLPGVGAAGHAMERLRVLGLVNVLRTLTQPVLGICLGMQLLLERTEEDRVCCLGILPGSARGLERSPARPAPHMGWNVVEHLKDDPLLEGVPDGGYAYFVHSYAMPATEHALAISDYGIRLSAVIRHRNFWGTQFHPERSSKVGARLLENFLKIEP